METNGSLPNSQELASVIPKLLGMCRNKIIFYGAELLAPRRTTKL